MNVIVGLEKLQADAPPELLSRVLIETGVGDGYVARQTAIGDVWLAFNSRGVSVCIPKDETDDVEGYLESVTGRQAFESPMPPELKEKVDEALAIGSSNAVPFDLRGVSAFGREVLTKTREIPPGEVRPYRWVAAQIGNPKATRAVGTALANNPVPVLIPCHRVVRSDGTVGKYAFGSDRKEAILRAEGVDLDHLDWFL